MAIAGTALGGAIGVRLPDRKGRRGNKKGESGGGSAGDDGGQRVAGEILVSALARARHQGARDRHDER